jgi:MFS transporter, PPP family, 3-phenylpropionic acid transporter
MWLRSLTCESDIQGDGVRVTTLAIGKYYAALYASVAVILTFFPVWIQRHGLTASQIGQILAVGHLVKAISIPVSSHLASWFLTQKQLLLLMIALTFAATSTYLAASGFLTVFACYAIVTAFSCNIMPLGESLVLPIIKRNGYEYGLLRRWGSISVVFVSIAAGMVVGAFPIDSVIVMLLACYAVLFASVLRLPLVDSKREPGNSLPFLSVLRIPGFILFLCSAATSQAIHAFFYGYGTIYWLSGGASAQMAGWLWAGGVASEVVVFSFGQRFAANWQPETTIAVACFVGVIRWGLLGSSDGLHTAIMVQLLQGGTLALTQMGVAGYINQRVPIRLVAAATGLYSWCAYAVFMAASAYIAGRYYAELHGGIFMLAAAACCTGATCACVLVGRNRRESARVI